MNDGIVEKRIRQWNRGARRSAQCIPVYATLLVLSILFFWLLGKWLTIPSTIKWIVIGLTFFTLVGDAANLLYCRRQIRRYT